MNSLLTRAQAAKYLGLSPKTLANWFATGLNSIPVVKLGRLCRYRQADLDAFVERNMKMGRLINHKQAER